MTRNAITLLSAILLVAVHALAADELRGIVRDTDNRPVAGAQIMATASGRQWRTTTDSTGAFLLSGPPNSSRLIVSAAGFAAQQIEAPPTGFVEVRLHINRRSEEVTVSATRVRTPVEETPTAAVLTASDVQRSGTQSIDEALRQVPGFSLFRRSSSETSNPTTLGVSLRGVGASGASRALVLADGIPINDPFGGWVYWGRVPFAAVDRIELVRGGTSDLYGTSALGGAINIVTTQPLDHLLTIQSSLGTEGTPFISGIASTRLHSIVATIAAEGFRTNGYVPVPADQRGAVDTVANSSHRTFDGRIDRLIGSSARVFVAGSYYGEDRQNGKVDEKNRAAIRQFQTGGDWTNQGAGSLSWRVFGGTEDLWQNFFAVAPDRNSENLTREQLVPAQQFGFSGQWSKSAGAHQLVAGVDGRFIEGESDETAYSSGTATSRIRSGGRQDILGVFGEDLIRLTPKLSLTLAARFDRWNDVDGRSLTTALAPTATSRSTIFPDRDETAFSPRLAATYKLTGAVSIYGSAFRAFRAPTLNELYRSFRVGNVLTLANETLRAERLTGAEAGLSERIGTRVVLRQSFFWNDINRPVTNATLQVTPDLITRQRQNLGRVRDRGIELSAETKLASNVYFDAGYQFANSRVESAPGNLALIGKLVPQVPRHEVTFQARYTNPKVVTAVFQGRWQGLQYDDDRNQFPLDSFFAANVFLSREIARSTELFLAADNVFNNRYVIGRTPSETIAGPVLARIGVQFTVGRR